MKKHTLAVHSGSYRDSATRGMNTPVFTSSAYDYTGRDNCPYPRYFNTLNQDVVVKKLCALEGAEEGLVFASGMAAISTAILAYAGKGDHVVLMDALYGGTHALATDWFHHFGIDYTFTGADADAVTAAVKDRTTVIVIESPTNPLLQVIDIKKVASFGKQRGIITIIDNTFASPVNQNPLALGIDIVVHSGTKYLGGHSDICCGFAVCAKGRIKPVLDLARCVGGSLDAQSCYLLERSMKTLVLRVERQTGNAAEIARFLEDHPGVLTVNYPGLENFPGHGIAKKQMSSYGAMLSFELKDHDPDAFIGKLALIQPAVSLGGVDTTICSPAKTSHSVMSAQERQRVGVSDALLRLSVGIEDPGDLIEDIVYALENC